MVIMPINVFRKKKRVKKLVLVFINSTIMTIARKKAVENVKDDENPGIAAGAGENSENLRSNLV